MSIIVQNLSHIYNPDLPTQWSALENISFTAERSAITSIVGHTGSGKSTLAQHLNGLFTPQSGKVIVGDISIEAKSPLLREVRSAVGLVFQYPEQQIFAETVREEVAFAPRNWGVSGEALEERVCMAMRAMGLEEDMLPRNPFELSGGQKRRVAIASVLAANPQYLVLDEPTAGLDAKGTRELMTLLRNCRSEGRCVVHITHDLELALSMSDKIIVLERGRLFAQGTPLEIAEKLCRESVKGLVLPDVLKLSIALRDAGRISEITWDAAQLAQMLGGAC